MAVSGNYTFGDREDIGANSYIRVVVQICNDVTVGVRAIVVEDIFETRVFDGNPVKKKD